VPLPLANPAGRRVRLLDADETLLPDAREDARARLTTPLLRARRGSWTVPDGLRERRSDWLGMLIVEGLMIRTVRVSGLECCELLGPGDVIRPWDGDDGLAPLSSGITWRVVDDTRVAVLDETFTRLACQWPAVLSELMERGLRRSRSLAVLLAIAQARRADVRLKALFWHLADRWGRMTSDGVVVDLELTHGLLSRLTNLRRPTVSVTLKELRASGELERLSKSCWLLRGARPGEHPQPAGLTLAA
jgi:CRP-like cAMP-binding protein